MSETFTDEYGIKYVDIGDDHGYDLTVWAPDRELNPQYTDLPDDPRIGAAVIHRASDGSRCMSAIYFDTEATRKLQAMGALKESQIWQVESWDPLTISPSLLCRKCGDHGFIRAGKWVRA